MLSSPLDSWRTEAQRERCTWPKGELLWTFSNEVQETSKLILQHAAALELPRTWEVSQPPAWTFLQQVNFSACVGT